MLRRSVLAAALAAVAAAQTGCQSRCGERRGLFSSHGRGDAPCQTVGRNTGCFDAATGQPVACPPGAPSVLPGGGVPLTGPLVPGGAGGFEVGPMPNLNNPADMIPRPNVPLAPPMVAPPPGPGGSDALLPLPTLPGTPVKGGPNK